MRANLLDEEDVEFAEQPAPKTSSLPASQVSAVNSAALRLPHAIIFDIETGPLPLDQLFKVVPPFDPSTIKPFPAFDPSAVKCGNLGDAKKAEKIAAAEAQHKIDAVEHEAKNATAEADYIASIVGQAALDATTGMVLAIGFRFTKEGPAGTEISFAADGSEKALLEYFWSFMASVNDECKLVGHNITGFDLPFLIRRSWILGVRVPHDVMQGGRYFNSNIVDTMRAWACGMSGNGSFVKLDRLAKALGVGSKNGDGAMFAELLKADKAAAQKYLENDIELTHQVARRLLVCQ